MWYALYNLIILLALPLLICALGVNRKYRAGLHERLGFIPHSLRRALQGERPIWLHAVSVGEVTASIPIIRRIKEEHPHLKIVLSTITATGNFTVRQKVPEVDWVIYFPYDYLPIVNRVIRLINPCIFIHTETEIWPNFLLVLERYGIPSVIINGRISLSSSRRYRFFGRFFRQVFQKVSFFGMQSAIDHQRVIEMGADPGRVLLTGNMKYDQKRVEYDPETLAELRSAFNLGPQEQVFVAGSTHAGEEEMILEVYQKLIQEHPRLVLILAPRHPERFQEVERLVKSKNMALLRKTQIRGKSPLVSPQVILLDTIGELSQTYALGDIIFVGGSLVNVGGHNILEPLVFKKPVLFGPHMQNFAEIAQTLQEAEAVIMVRSKEELWEQSRALLKDRARAELLGTNGFEVIRKHQGATEKNMAMINRFLSEKGGEQRA